MNKMKETSKNQEDEKASSMSRHQQPDNQETTPEEIREETIEEEVEVKAGEARAFYFDKGAKTFQKYLAKKGFIEERKLREIVPPFKEEIKRRGWEAMCKNLELGRRAMAKEFYANLGDRKNLTSYVRWR